MLGHRSRLCSAVGDAADPGAIGAHVTVATTRCPMSTTGPRRPRTVARFRPVDRARRIVARRHCLTRSTCSSTFGADRPPDPVIFAETGPAHRLLPPRRLAPLHRRVFARPTRRPEPRRRSLARLLRRRGGRRPGRLRVRQARSDPLVQARRTRRLFKQEYVERADEFFERHGPKTIVLARFVPGRAHVRADPRRRRLDALPHLRHVQRDRRASSGRSA